MKIFQIIKIFREIVASKRPANFGKPDSGFDDRNLVCGALVGHNNFPEYLCNLKFGSGEIWKFGVGVFNPNTRSC